MKNIGLFFCLLFSFVASGQPDYLPASLLSNNKQALLVSYFNSDTIKFFGIDSVFGKNGLFILYEKSDTLDFSNPFYQTDTPFNSMGATSKDYIEEGLAYYKKDGAGFEKIFANDDAFPCASCENMGKHEIHNHQDTIDLSYDWGPHHGWEDIYTYVYRPPLGRWQVTAYLSRGFNDMGEGNIHYTEYNGSASLFLDGEGGHPEIFSKKGIERELAFTYTPGKYHALLNQLEKIPTGNTDLLRKVFTEEDAKLFTGEYWRENSIDANNVVAANNIGYFLEKVNALAAAKPFLESVIEKFPQREVAYLNLADVYRKQGKKSLALKNYRTYIRLMKSEGREDKIPKRVKDFVLAN